MDVVSNYFIVGFNCFVICKCLCSVGRLCEKNVLMLGFFVFFDVLLNREMVFLWVFIFILLV